ncbi:MAG: hypothetical protein M0Z48_07995 [Nitrospiraceae bacterium]|nr:hypothetical protein [Nitrospiraceae bacterium]
MRILACLSLIFLLAGCGTVNNALSEKTKRIEYYRIYDVKTSADKDQIIHAASKGLGENVNNANESTPIPDFTEPPAKPGRFKLINPFGNTGMGSLLAANGIKLCSCDGAVWIAKANRNTKNSSDLNLTVCLFQYKGGYQVDEYAVFSKEEGGLMQLGRSLANAMVGTPEEWTEKTLLDVVRNISRETHADISFVEGYPKISGTPWLDSQDKSLSQK